jgi:hypothetical protein
MQDHQFRHKATVLAPPPCKQAFWNLPVEAVTTLPSA